MSADIFRLYCTDIPYMTHLVATNKQFQTFTLGVRAQKCFSTHYKGRAAASALRSVRAAYFRAPDRYLKTMILPRALSDPNNSLCRSSIVTPSNMPNKQTLTLPLCNSS